MPTMPDSISLPMRFSFDALRALVRRWPIESQEIRVQFHPRQWVYPVGIVGLSCLIELSQRHGANVDVVIGNCPNAGYWERMGFFDILGLAPSKSNGPAARTRSALL